MEIESKIVYQILVPYIIGLITIVAPISVSIISSLNTQYNSSRILGLFMKERTTCWLTVFIPSNIAFVIAFVLDKPRLNDYGFWNPIIDHSAFVLTVLSCGISLLILGCFIKTMIKFLNPKKLTEYIVEYSPKIPTNQNNKKELDTEYIKYLSILSDIYIYTIEKEKDDALIIKDKIISLLEKEKRLREEYSDPIIQTIIASFYLKKTNTNTLSLNRINAKFLNFFIYDKKEKSNFSVLWKLVTITVSNQNMFIFSNYLSKAGFFSSNLPRNLPYETKRANRFKDKHNFLYFNLWLFSYLLYKKEFIFLQEVFYENKEVLDLTKFPIPYNIDEIMTVYLYFCKFSLHDDFSSNLFFSESGYLRDCDIKKEWSKKLCAILFIRLLVKSLTEKSENDPPKKDTIKGKLNLDKKKQNTPEKKTKYILNLNFGYSDSIEKSSDCRLLVENLDALKKDIEKFLKQEKLIKTLQLSDEQDKVDFLKKNLDETFKTHREKLEDSLKTLQTKDAKTDFNNSFDKVKERLKTMQKIFKNSFKKEDGFKKGYIYGVDDVTKIGIRGSSVKDTIMFNTDNAFASISKRYNTQKYDFSNEEEIESAVEILLSENNNLIAIVSGYKNASKLTPEEIRFQQLFRKNSTIEIKANKDNVIWLNDSQENTTQDYVVYILPKAYLPGFTLKPFTSEQKNNSVEKLGLNEYEGDKEVNNLYFKVEDLSKKENPKVDNLIPILKERGYEDLEDSVFTSITFIGKFTYVPSTPMLCFKRYDQFTSTSIKSYVEDIKAQKKKLLTFLSEKPQKETETN